MHSESKSNLPAAGYGGPDIRIFVVDVGGTHMRIAEASGETLRQIEKIPTPPDAQGFYGTMAHSMQARLNGSEPFAVGISSAGVVDTDRGWVLGSAGNVPALQEAPNIRDRLMAQFDYPPRAILVENDANAAVFAEAHLGAGWGKADVVLVIIGTGVGAGIVKDGRLFHTRHFMAGEIGHTVIEQHPDRECTLCGYSGCLESYASGPGLLKTARIFLEQERHTPLGQIAPDALTTYDLVQAWQAGDGVALNIKAQWHRHIAQGLYNLVMTLDPQIVVLGGGMSQVVDYPLLNRLVREQTRLPVPADVTIVPAQLGDHAGMLGVALLARHPVAS